MLVSVPKHDVVNVIDGWNDHRASPAEGVLDDADEIDGFRHLWCDRWRHQRVDLEARYI